MDEGALEPKKVREIRLKKLKLLIDEQFKGRPGPFADAISRSRPVIYRLFSDAANKRGLGENLAREIESRFGKPPGWMDTEADLNRPPRPLAECRRIVNELLERMTPPEREEAIALLERMAPIDHVRSIAAAEKQKAKRAGAKVRR